MANNDSQQMFLNKGPFDDLVIETTDGTKLYVSKGWLYNVSDYFKALLSNGLSETNTTEIKLSYSSKILKSLFECVFFAYLKKEYIEKNILDKFDKLDDIYDFISACEEYQLTTIKEMCDNYFSKEEQLVSLFSTKLIEMILIFKMNQMKISLENILKLRDGMIKNLDYQNIRPDSIKFIINSDGRWTTHVDVCTLWFEKQPDLDDIELRKSGFYVEYQNMPTKLIPKMVNSLDFLTKAKKFQSYVNEKLVESYVNHINKGCTIPKRKINFS